MRSRRASNKKPKNYAAAFRLGSDDSGSEANEIQDAEADVVFDVGEGEGEGEGASEEGPADNSAGEGAAEVEEPEVDGDVDEQPPDEADEAAVESDASEESSPDLVPMRKGQRLPRRSHLHEIPPYPSDLRTARIYDGPLKHDTCEEKLTILLYGPDRNHVDVFRGMLKKWFDLQVLPPGRVGQRGVMSSPWLSEDFEEKSRQWSRVCHERLRFVKLQRLQKIRPDHINMFKPRMDSLVCFVGRSERQKQVQTRYGFGQSVAENGQPLETNDGAPLKKVATPKGWLLDTGGIPLAIGWAPSTGLKEQYLAVCSVPFSDHESKDGSSPDDDPEEKKRGSVRIWSIPCHRTGEGDAVLLESLSFDWGRPRRLQWCPVPSADETSIGLIAVLAADGLVRVIEVPKVPSGQENYDWVDAPVATLGIIDEYAVKTTCLTWVNINRICLGHSDGSVSLWSVNPQHMLSRRSVHNTNILDIASGYPSHPYHIATSPVSGCVTLTDLNLPSAETTFIPTPVANFQSNLLDWNDHLQGFFGAQPSLTPQNTVVGWAHIKFFVQSRTILTPRSPPTCIASGKTHPFTLVGCADGSLWAFNPMRVLMKERFEVIHKLQIFQHEFRPPHKVPFLAADDTIRGAARITQGFRPVFNNNPRPDIHAILEDYQRRVRMRRPVVMRKDARKRRPRKTLEDENEGENGMTLNQEANLAKAVDQSKVVVHEARTRITMVAWNPNVEFGWWAAAAMGSGLVKVMDLGLADKPVARTS